jgi:tRNA pseudouridine38-40 synthase
MRNIKITFAYNGSKFNGSAKQPSCLTVQGKFENVLTSLGIKDNLIFSGRTDKNVHAIGQVASVKIPFFWNDLDRLYYKLSNQLSNDIKIKKIEFVPDYFHARFSAKKRAYRYIISTKKLTPFNSDYFYYFTNIDEDRIKQAIKLFIGVYDFEYFSKKGSETKTTIKKIYDIKFYKYKEFYIFKFIANSYLRSQIRIMVDFILKISSNLLTCDDLKQQLYKKKFISNSLAPPNGLYLVRVYY